MNWKLNHTYEDFFVSIGYAISVCTLLVSIGKCLTGYYFICILTLALLIMVPLAVYDYLKAVKRNNELVMASFYTSVDVIGEMSNAQEAPNSVVKEITAKRQTTFAKMRSISHRSLLNKAFDDEFLDNMTGCLSPRKEHKILVRSHSKPSPALCTERRSKIGLFNKKHMETSV